MGVQKFIHPLPKTILDNNDQRPFFEYMVNYLQANAVGTIAIGSDLTDAEVAQLYPSGSEAITSEEIQFVEEVETLVLTKKTISNETYTAQDNMFINMTNDSILIFPEHPIEGSVIYFTKDATRARIRGNGKKINGTTEEIVFQQNRLARQVHYFSDVGEWFFV